MRKAVSLFSIALAFILADSAQADMINGGFEAGDFSGWTRGGFLGQNLPDNGINHNFESYISNQNAGVVAADSNSVLTSQSSNFDGYGPATSPAIGPAGGNYFAFLSNQTAAGDGTLIGSSLSQTFTVSPGATALTFNVQFLSNEDIDSGWDFGGVALLLGNTVIDQVNLDHQTPSNSVANIQASAVPSGGFRDSSGWANWSFSLAGYAGQDLTMIAYVTNTGDKWVESRLLLDNVVVQGEVAPVPEPASILLFVTGVVGIVGHGIRAWKQQSS